MPLLLKQPILIPFLPKTAVAGTQCLLLHCVDVPRCPQVLLARGGPDSDWEVRLVPVFLAFYVKL